MNRLTRKFHRTLILLSALVAVLQPAESFAAATGIDASSVYLVDESGQSVNLGSYRGSPHLVFFGYTYCPDICPLTLYSVATALKSMGSAADDLKVLFISVDPRRDTPEVLARYTDAFHPAMIGLTGSYDQISNATEVFRTTFGYHIDEDGRERPLSEQEYLQMPADSAYVPYHSSQIYLLGADGVLLDIIGYGSKPDDIAARIRENLALPD